jgi:hypothetical protein
MYEGSSYIHGRVGLVLVGLLQPLVPLFVQIFVDAGVETAVALSSVPACPYAGPLLTSTRVEETLFGVFASVDPNAPRELVPFFSLIGHMLRSKLGMMTGWEPLKGTYLCGGSVAVVL